MLDFTYILLNISLKDYTSNLNLYSTFFILVHTHQMNNGKVKFYNEEKGFGFIIPSDGSEQLFFHISQVQQGYELPREGDDVTYTVGAGKDGRAAAQNVGPASGGSSDMDMDMDDSDEE